MARSEKEWKRLEASAQETELRERPERFKAAIEYLDSLGSVITENDLRELNKKTCAYFSHAALLGMLHGARSVGGDARAYDLLRSELRNELNAALNAARAAVPRRKRPWWKFW
jgi:hypothetical protein